MNPAFLCESNSTARKLMRAQGPLRILVAHNVPCSRTGGMSRIMSLIHDRIVAAGHTVEYFCAEHANCHGRSARFSFPLAVYRHVKRQASRNHPYDIVNVHEPSGAVVAALPLPSKVVITSHGVEQQGWHRTLEEQRLGRTTVPLKSRIGYRTTVLWQANFALRRADHIFCLSNDDRAYLSTHFSIPSTKITRIYPGADSIYGFVARGRDYSKATTLLFAGTWIPRKGISDLVSAFAVLSEKNTDLRLIVLNGGKSDPTILADFPEHLRNRIECISAEPEVGIANVLARADIYILPSIYEGTPLTMMEAMRTGLPVITSDTCGMKDVINDGKNGLKIPMRSPEHIVSSVERLLTDVALRERLGRAAHADAQDCYSWEAASKPVLDAYIRLACL